MAKKGGNFVAWLALIVSCVLAFGMISQGRDKGEDSTTGTNTETSSPIDSGEEGSSGSEGDTPVVLRLEAEDAVITGGSVNSEYGDGSASGSWVGALDTDGANVAFNVKIETAGTYEVRVSYATAMEGSTLHWNISPYSGMNGGEVSCPATASENTWGIFDTATLNTEFALDAGDYTFTLTRSINSVEIDYVEFVLI